MYRTHPRFSAQNLCKCLVPMYKTQVENTNGQVLMICVWHNFVVLFSGNLSFVLLMHDITTKIRLKTGEICLFLSMCISTKGSINLPPWRIGGSMTSITSQSVDVNDAPAWTCFDPPHSIPMYKTHPYLRVHFSCMKMRSIHGCLRYMRRSHEAQK